MIGDADVQVWLDAQPAANQVVMIPYVKSGKELRIRYRIELVQQQGGSTSRISQQGSLTALAAQPTQIGRIAVGPRQGGECRMELILRDDANTREIGNYRFECPP